MRALLQLYKGHTRQSYSSSTAAAAVHGGDPLGDPLLQEPPALEGLIGDKASHQGEHRGPPARAVLLVPRILQPVVDLPETGQVGEKESTLPRG